MRHPDGRSSKSLTSFFLYTMSFVALSMSACGFAQTWSGGSPYGGDVKVLLQSSDGQVLFAQTGGGLFRSDDHGAHWARKLAGSPGSGPGQFMAVAQSDAQPGRIYVGDINGHVYRSDDNGETIANVSQLPTPSPYLIGLVGVPGSTNQLFALTETSGVWYSDDAGVSFVSQSAGLTDDEIVSRLVISAEHPGWIAALAPYFSSNLYFYTGPTENGDWRNSSGFSGRPLAIAFAGDGLTYLTTETGSYTSNYLVGIGWTEGNWGLCGSTHDILLDSTTTDVAMVGCDEGIVRRSSPVLVQPLIGYGTAAPVNQLLRDEVDPSRLWAATDQVGVFDSTDGGDTWSGLNEGLAGSVLRTVAVHPHFLQRIYAGYDETGVATRGIVLSDDGGNTWATSDIGRFVYGVRAIAVDPTSTAIATTTVYATGNGFKDSGLFKSLDGGNHWNELAGPYLGTARDIALDPRSCASPPPQGPCSDGPLRTFYAISDGTQDTENAYRILRSDDAGATLMDRSNGLPASLRTGNTSENVFPLALALEPRATGHLYVSTYDRQTQFGEGEVPTRTLANGVFRSTDSGLSWQPANTGLLRYPGSTDSALNIFALAVHPRTSGVVWAAGAFDDGEAGSHLFHTDDGGDHWQEQAAFADCDLRKLLIDPATPDVVYASGRSVASQGTGCVVRTQDAGANWTRIDTGLPATSIFGLASVPGEQGHVLAATNTGVWHLHDATDAVFKDGFD